MGRPGSCRRPFDIVTPYRHFVRADHPRGPPGMRDRHRRRATAWAARSPSRCSGAMGFDVVALFCEMDARLPEPPPGPDGAWRTCRTSSRAVKEEKAEVGIAYDGDADRMGVVDDQGNILWGDQLMILFSREVLKRAPGAAIVGEVKCSMHALRRHRGARRQADHVEGGPLAHQGQDEGDRRPARRRDERPHLLQAPLLRLRRRACTLGARLLEILTHDAAADSRPLLADVPQDLRQPRDPLRRAGGEEVRHGAAARPRCCAQARATRSSTSTGCG